VHLGFCATPAVAAALSSPGGSTGAFRRLQDFVSRDRPAGVGLPDLVSLAGRYDGGGPTGGDRVMARAGVEGTIGSDAADLLFGRDLSNSSGSIGASPTLLVVNSAARISRDFSSIPMWILGQTLRSAPPCLQAFHSPSPSTLMPLAMVSRTSGVPMARCRPADAADHLIHGRGCSPSGFSAAATAC
jgi:hypothetical protein